MELPPSTSTQMMLRGQMRRIRRCEESLVSRLRQREMYGGGRKPERVWNEQRKFYSSIYPNLTVVNVEKPACFLRKFSPDGRLLVAFGGQQTGVEIYEYQGVEQTGQLLHNLSGVVLCHDDEYGSTEIRKSLFRVAIKKGFQTLFKLKFVVGVIEGPSGEQLNRECSLFTWDSKHLLLAAVSSSTQDEHSAPQISHQFQSNESLQPSTAMPPEDVHIFCIDLTEGRVCDKRLFKADKIFLPHNQGLYLFERLLAVLSVQHQTIHLFQVEESTGQLVPLQCIGRFLFDDDELMIQNSINGAGSRNTMNAVGEETLGGLKHRLLALLYRKAVNQSKSEGTPTAVQRFYQRFDTYRSLRMWRMQLLDREHLLIRMASENMVALKVDPSSQHSIFIIYNITSTEIEGIFDNTSPQLLHLYEAAADIFRHPEGGVRFPCSLSSCREAKEQHERYKRTILNAKGGGEREVRRRVLTQLPICAQSFSSSPYLDLSLFSYDDKLVSMLERPKACGDCPVRFYCRSTNQLRFQLYCGLASRGSLAPVHSQRSLVAFIFHPTDPFAISVQRNNRDYVVNFHLRGATGLTEIDSTIPTQGSS